MLATLIHNNNMIPGFLLPLYHRRLCDFQLDFHVMKVICVVILFVNKIVAHTHAVQSLTSIQADLPLMGSSTNIIGDPA